MNNMAETHPVVLLTGAGSGLGRALSIRLAQEGYRVIGTGRTSESLEATQTLVKTGLFEWRLMDVADAIQTDEVVAELIESYGSIDILINNAGVFPKEWFLDQSAQAWEQAVRINLMGPANCMRAVLPAMLEKGYGRIINLGSFSDRNPPVESSAYSTSKGGLHALSKAVAGEIDRQTHPNVLINELTPGPVKTQMSDFQGRTPEQIYPWVKDLIELKMGGYNGKIYNQGNWEIPQPSMKQRIKRKLKFWKR